MGLYDTMQQGKQPMQGNLQNAGNQVLSAVGNGGSFAQKQQMRANPMMKRPAMGASFGQPNTSQTPNPMTGARPAMGMQPGMQGGSRDMMQQKMQQLKAQQAGTQMGSYNELAANNPQLQQNRQTGMNAGQDMSWMDKPGALQLPQGYGQAPPQRPQSGLQDVASRYAAEQNPQSTQDMNRTEPNAMEQQIMASKPNAIMGAVQNGGASGPMGTTMGQEDPRQQQYNTWLNGGGGENPYATPEPQRGIGPSDNLKQLQGMTSLNAGDPNFDMSNATKLFGGEMMGGNSLQQTGGGQTFGRPQVMPRRRR